jgi:hypothetical protein
MLGEEWIRWEPKIGLTTKYYVCTKKHFGNSLELFLSDSYTQEKDLKITFNNSVFFYNSTDENCHLLRIGNLINKYGRDIFGKSRFFKVYNSDWLNWISKSTENNIDFKKLTHFAFVDSDIFLDVIASEEPEVIEIDPEESLKIQQRRGGSLI